MIVPAYLPYYVVAGTIGVIAAILFGLSSANFPSRECPQMKVKPKNAKVSGLPIPRSLRLFAAPVGPPMSGPPRFVPPP